MLSLCQPKAKPSAIGLLGTLARKGQLAITVSLCSLGLYVCNLGSMKMYLAGRIRCPAWFAVCLGVFHFPRGDPRIDLAAGKRRGLQGSHFRDQ